MLVHCEGDSVKGQEGTEGRRAVEQWQHCPPQQEHHVTCHVPPGASHIRGICHVPPVGASHRGIFHVLPGRAHHVSPGQVTASLQRNHPEGLVTSNCNSSSHPQFTSCRPQLVTSSPPARHQPVTSWSPACPQFTFSRHQAVTSSSPARLSVIR